MIVDCNYGLDLNDTIEKLDWHTQIDRHNGSFDTFEVLVLHMPQHHRAPLFHDLLEGVLVSELRSVAEPAQAHTVPRKARSVRWAEE